MKEKKEGASAEIGRRGVLKLFGTIPLAAGAALARPATAEAQHPRHQSALVPAAKGKPSAPKFFDAHEWATVAVLADMVIPRDGRSGSATDAGVPEFIDFILSDPLGDPRELEEEQTAVRGGLAWLDRECGERFGKTFLDASDAERRAVLDDIAFPEKARPEMKPGVAFFNRFRDLVASGFWTSRMGVADLRYIGNTFVAEWKGCPPEVLARLGLEPQ